MAGLGDGDKFLVGEVGRQRKWVFPCFFMLFLAVFPDCEMLLQFACCFDMDIN